MTLRDSTENENNVGASKLCFVAPRNLIDRGDYNAL